MYAPPPPPPEETFWFRVIGLNKEEKEKKVTADSGKKTEAHTPLSRFNSLRESLSRSRGSGALVLYPKKRHEAPRAASALAVGLVERRSRRACCCCGSRGRSRRLDDDGAPRGSEPGHVRCGCCSASRGDQVRRFHLCAPSLERAYVSLPSFHSHFSQRSCAREGKRLRQMPLLFETTQALFSLSSSSSSSRPLSFEALCLSLPLFRCWGIRRECIASRVEHE